MVKNSESNHDQLANLKAIDQILFINNAILIDPFIFSSIVRDIYNEDQMRQFYDNKKFIYEFIITFTIDIQNLKKFFKVIF